ncbi:MAG: glycoside hydrolase family 97 protein [Oscillospiraceae bacterium]|jgi:alpha-glucosidase|nr:glycoside hydrolase family 97 protein [Oscillospiraceae bacterium]
MAVFELASPNGGIVGTIALSDGALQYRVAAHGTPLLDASPLGILLDTQDLRGGFTFLSERRERLHDEYVIPAFKKSRCINDCNSLSLRLTSTDGELRVEARAYDDGFAVRLVVPGDGRSAVLDETCAFAVPSGARNITGMKHVFSYEDHYHPIPLEDLWQNRLAMPVLVEAGAGKWALYTEAAVFGDYGGSHLLSTPENPALLRLMKAEDKPTPIQSDYPVKTPWRVVMGETLADILSSNLLENLNPPSIVDDPSFIRPGVSAWSWMAENDSVTDPIRIRQYVDYASEMGFPYYLADWGWPGTVDIPALVKYAAERNVKIWIWEHSADMRDAGIAEEKLALWSSWGVVGVKIDFFESDGAERMAQFDMLAALGAKYRLMLNFHGCTKPAGESRTWPHVMTREGVQGGEYLQNFSTFTPSGPDAAHNCTLPFTRNAVGPMDYTPVMYKTYRTGTTHAHQTALMVIFTSYIQHIGERGDYVLESPFRPFLSAVPAAWDETRLLEGYPGSYVTIARRSGEEWYVAGICARRPRNALVKLSFLEDHDYIGTLYADALSDMRPFDVAIDSLPPASDELCAQMAAARMRPALHQHGMHLTRIEELALCSGATLKIPLAPNGGFILHIRKKKKERPSA